MSQELVNSHVLPSSHKMKSSCISPEPSMKCTKIGNYIISSTLGEGTFSKVKLGVHLPTQQKVAIKILDKSKIKDESDIERISREIHILKAIRHPNIVQLYETITTDNHIYIIMEYVEGKHLFQYIESKVCLNEEKSSALFRQIISVMEYIHTLGIVHRDIKPDNILLDKSKNNLKIVDFGLSNSYKHGDLLRTPCGSPCYAAPEIISGKHYNGLYSDLWSCGIVLYCMLTGRLPFDDPDIKVLYKKIKSGHYMIPNNISDIAKDFLSKILKTNPEKRIKLEEIKKHPFFLKGCTKCPILNKGILIGIEDIPIDVNIVTEMKEKYYQSKNDITEEYIMENLASNNHNSITAVYYLLMKQKKDENKSSKTESRNKKIAKNNVERKQCDTFNLSTIKKISFDNIGKANEKIINNSNTTNNNNRFNVVVINTFLGETNPNTMKNTKKNSVIVNLDSQNKLNASTSINNNVITTKINLNDVISNQISRQKSFSRNMIDLKQSKHNKTVSGYNNFSLNNSLNGLIIKQARSKDHEIQSKFLFSSPNNSQDNLVDKDKKIIKKNMKQLYKSTSKPRNYSKQKKKKKNVKKNYIKKIFENDTPMNNTSLNMTCYVNNNNNSQSRNSKEKQNESSKPSKNSTSTKNSVNKNKHVFGSYVPRINVNIPKKASNNTTHINGNTNQVINQIIGKKFSLSLNKTKEKIKSTSKDKKANTMKSSSLNKKKNTLITNTTLVHFTNNTNIGNKAKIGFGSFNLNGVVKKTFSKEKMIQKKNISKGRNKGSVSKGKTMKSTSKGKISLEPTNTVKQATVNINI